MAQVLRAMLYRTQTGERATSGGAISLARHCAGAVISLDEMGLPGRLQAHPPPDWPNWSGADGVEFLIALSVLAEIAERCSVPA